MAILHHLIGGKFFQRKLLSILVFAALFISSFLLIDYLGIQILSVVRAYVHGESAYSKGQKNALIHLNRYIVSHREEDYSRYLQQIAIPVADKRARVELEKQHPNLLLASKWFMQGGNHPEDARQMVRFFAYLPYYEPTREAVQIWRKADSLIEKLNTHATTIHQLIGHKQTTRQALQREINEILHLNEQLTLLQEDFSSTLGAIARQTEKVLFVGTCMISLLLFILFTLIASRTLRSLNESEEKYRTLFEESINGIMICNAAGKLTDANPKAILMLALPQTGKLPMVTLQDIFAKIEDGAWLHKEFLLQGKLKSIEIQLLHNTIIKGFALLTASTQYRDGKISSYRIIIEDITERKFSEQLLKEQNQELQKINLELDSFVYRASHDLRAPLSSILGLIEISKLESDPAVLAHYLELMSKSINKLDLFIKNIIAYSKNTRLDICYEQIDFKALLDEVFDNLQYMEGVAKIEKKIELQLTQAFYTDAFRLQTIFSNFISNAIKYSNPATKAYLLVKIQTDERKAIIEFIDNGIGIAEENIDKIFNMFFRATGLNAGSGLGLYIVKEALTVLKGSIQVSSQVGKGTHFTIELPNMPPIE